MASTVPLGVLSSARFGLGSRHLPDTLGGLSSQKAVTRVPDRERYASHFSGLSEDWETMQSEYEARVECPLKKGVININLRSSFYFCKVPFSL